MLKPLFSLLDSSLSIKTVRDNSDTLEKGTRICLLEGRIRAILAGERTALNFLQHLSGIATLTRNFVDSISHTRAKILDTRKTTPLLRLLEKQAVIHGGGANHRFGLYDMILIKNTHILAAGGVGKAVRQAQEYVKKERTSGEN